eukprot:scaffold24734_cov61-Phaeocystis_antarctica.AAC.14
MSLLLLVPSPFFALIPAAPLRASSYVACIWPDREKQSWPNHRGACPWRRLGAAARTVAYPRRTSTNGQLRFSRPTRSTAFQSSTEASHLSSPPPLPTSQHLLCQLACCRTYVAHHGVVCAQVISSSLFGAWCVSDALSNATHLYT